MVTLETVNESLTSIFENFDNILSKADIYLESSVDELEINSKEASLKVMQEDGTVEDLAYLEAAAEESFKDRAIKLMKALIEKFKEFIEKTITNIRSFFAKNSTEKAIAKIEDSIKKYPEIRGLKVSMRDPKKLAKEYDDNRSTLQKLMAKFKTGNAKSSDKKQLEKIAKDNENRGLSISKRVAITTISVASAIALIKVAKDLIFKDKYNDTLNCNSRKDLDKMDSDTVMLASRASNLYWDSWRFKVTNIWEIIVEGFDDIKKVITAKLSGIVAKESSSDERIRDIYSKLYVEDKDDDKDDSETDDKESNDDADNDDDDDDKDKDKKKKDDKESEDAPDDDDGDDKSKKSKSKKSDKDSDDEDDEDDDKKKKSKSKKSDDDEDADTDDSDEDDKDKDKKKKADEPADGDVEEPIEESAFNKFFGDNDDDSFDRFFGESSDDTVSDLFNDMDTNFFD